MRINQHNNLSEKFKIYVFRKPIRCLPDMKIYAKTMNEYPSVTCDNIVDLAVGLQFIYFKSRP